MSESVIADFVGHFVAEGAEEPSRGRVLLSQKRLVLATGDDERSTIPLSSVFDVGLGQVPPDLSEFFNDSVTIAYEQGGRRRVAVVEGENETIDKFVTVLFRALLNGVEVLAVHPARVGGRVQETEPAPASLELQEGAIAFDGPNSFAVDLMTVSDFEKKSREIAGTSRPALSVRHVPDGTAMRSVIALDAQRKLNLLGRYLRREYSDLQEDLEEIELSNDQVEALIALYSAGGSADLTTMLGDPSRANMLLNSLKEDALVADGPDGTELTPKGRIVVNTRLEGVN